MLKMCVYCEKEIGLEELIQVDLSVKNIESEKAEFIWDQLPNTPLLKRKQDKFLHMTDLGYKVLNICKECYQKALKKYGDCA